MKKSRYAIIRSLTRPQAMLWALLLVVFGAAGCQKTGFVAAEPPPQAGKDIGAVGEFRTWYCGIEGSVLWELQGARAATAKYKNFDNALRDGYVDINVVRANMGHHYLNPDLLDGTFDPRRPEILVYNKAADGSFYLVAVEYARPVNLPEPAGFSGSSDVWTNSSEFNLWLLHAWLWQYNPAGVFKPTNPNVYVDPDLIH